MDYQDIFKKASIVVKDAAAFIKTNFGKVVSDDIITKEFNSLVSYVDQQAENILTTGLKEILPVSGFITEEETITQDQNQELVWIIDPLDGTTNFLHNVPNFAVSVALSVNGKIVIGMVYYVIPDDYYHAITGQGAFKNNLPIRVSNKPFSQSIFATGFPYTNEYQIDQYLSLLKFVLTNSRGIRRFGSAALDLCYVASGRVQGYYEGNLNPWDIAAGALIVQEAGGAVSDYTGGNTFSNGKEIIAANEPIRKILEDKISTLLKE